MALSRRGLLKTTGAGLVTPGVLASAALPLSPVVTTATGRLRGATDNGIQVFKGIPYGDDTAPRRFQPALPPKPWRGIRDALHYAPASPQTRAEEPISEDCLALNVWTPGLDAHSARPVMVYFHGGEFNHGSGSSPLYDGTRLCRRGDVVVVTVNHRLAAFGHLSLGRIGGPAYAASGNVALLDLVQALGWVRDNIQNFGGDPNCVTVFGQSGGGAKIATLMAMPAAKGLFHRAITMSGQQITASGPLAAEARARVFFSALKIPPDRLDLLQTVPMAALIAAMDTADPTQARSSLYWGPVVDEVVLARHPFYPDAPPQSAQIPMIIGNTHDETRAFFRNDPSLFELTWDSLPARLGPELRVDIEPATVVATYRTLYPALSPTDVFFAATTAGRSWRGAVMEAEARARQGAPVYAYQLDWPSPLENGRLGAPHTLDITLAFDNIVQPGSLTGTGPDAQHMADQMSTAFIIFARTGDPNCTAIPTWPTYDLSQRKTMLFNLPSQVADDPRGAERKLFEKVPFIQRGTY